MTETEAYKILVAWQQDPKHRRDELVRLDATDAPLTSTGRLALKKLLGCDLRAVRAAMDCTDLEDRFPAFPGVLERLRGVVRPGRKVDPGWLQDMKHGDICQHVSMPDYVAVVDFTGADGKIVWVVARSRLQSAPYWAVLAQCEYEKHPFELCDPERSRQIVSAWAANLERKVYDGYVPECVRHAVDRYVPRPEPALEPEMAKEPW